MALTEKQEKFCVEYIRTGNASAAYRHAYDTSKSKESSVNVNACKLLADAKIAQRIEELRIPARETAQMTLADHLNDLKRLRDLAAAAENYSAAVTAETNRGKASGLYTEKLTLDATVVTMTDEQRKARLLELTAKLHGANKAGRA